MPLTAQVEGVDAVHVLLRGHAVDYPVGVDVHGQGQLHQHPVHALLPIQLPYCQLHFLLCSILSQLSTLMRNSYLVTSSFLQIHILCGRRQMTHLYEA